MDYGLPRADNIPSFTCEISEVLSPTNPLGIKAGGEGGTTGAPAAVVSAIVDALSVYGIRNITMPATPYAVWKAIREAKGGLTRVPGAAQHEVVRCRPGTVPNSVSGTIPDQRCTVALRFTLHRVRDTLGIEAGGEGGCGNEI